MNLFVPEQLWSSCYCQANEKTRLWKPLSRKKGKKRAAFTFSFNGCLPQVVEAMSSDSGKVSAKKGKFNLQVNSKRVPALTFHPQQLTVLLSFNSLTAALLGLILGAYSPIWFLPECKQISEIICGVECVLCGWEGENDGLVNADKKKTKS